MKRKIIEVKITPNCIYVINFDGEKGTDGYGRIAFLPRRMQGTELYGEYVCLTIRGKEFRDPYSGSVLKKGYLIVRPATEKDVTLKIEMRKVLEEVNLYYRIQNIHDEDEILGFSIKVNIDDLNGMDAIEIIKKYSPEFVSNLPASVISQAEKDFLRSFNDVQIQYHEGYHIIQANISIQRGYFVVNKKMIGEDPRYMDLPTIIQKYKGQIKGTIVLDPKDLEFQRRDAFPWNNREVGVKLKEPCWKFAKVNTMKELEALLPYCENRAAAMLYELINEQKERDIEKLESEKTKITKELKEITGYKDEIITKELYKEYTKDEFIKLLEEVTNISLTEQIITSFSSDEYRSDEEIKKQRNTIRDKIKEIAEIPFNTIYVRQWWDGVWEGMYVESDFYVEAIIPQSKEISLQYIRVSDGYEEESAEILDYDVKHTNMTIEQIIQYNREKQEEIEKMIKSREERIKTINETIKVLNDNPLEHYWEFIPPLQKRLVVAFSHTNEPLKQVREEEEGIEMDI